MPFIRQTSNEIDSEHCALRSSPITPSGVCPRPVRLHCAAEALAEATVGCLWCRRYQLISSTQTCRSKFKRSIPFRHQRYAIYIHYNCSTIHIRISDDFIVCYGGQQQICSLVKKMERSMGPKEASYTSFCWNSQPKKKMYSQMNCAEAIIYRRALCAHLLFAKRANSMEIEYCREVDGLTRSHTSFRVIRFFFHSLFHFGSGCR